MGEWSAMATEAAEAAAMRVVGGTKEEKEAGEGRVDELGRK